MRDEQVLYSTDDGTLYMSWSAMKPFVTVVMYQLHEEGLLDLDAPISWLWPEFAVKGKRAVTTRDVLQHRSGLDIRLPEVLNLFDPAKAAAVTAGLKARRTREDKAHYQVLAFGVVLGEIAKRITHKPLGELIQQRIGPSVGEVFLGLPEELEHRGAVQTGSGPFGLAARVAASARARRSPIASGGLWLSSTALAKFYENLPLLVSSESLQDILTESFNGHDGTTFMHTRWGNGMQLGVDNTFFGTKVSPRLYGHNGSAICIGWHDPDTRLSVGMTHSHIQYPRAAIKELRLAADWVQENFGDA